MGTISPGKGKLQKLLDFNLPKNLQQIQAFFGLASYYRKFIAMFVAKALTCIRKGFHVTKLKSSW